MPISDRNPSAQMLAVHGRLFLLDCGEGTQQQMRRARLSFLKVEAIFITHIHGDHIFGIFGLLSSMAMYGRTEDLRIFGPQALGPILKFCESYYGSNYKYKIVFTPVSCREPEVIYASKHLTVSAFPLNHHIECYGYKFEELVDLPGIAPKTYAYCTDTAPFPQLPCWVKGVDLLYHEATFPEEMADKAAFRWHSTTVQAARCALDAGAGKLIVGHYSSRITDFDAYLKECTDIFSETVAAQDGDVFDF